MKKKPLKIGLILILTVILIGVQCGCSSSGDNVSKNLTFSEPSIYVDNESRQRSGHMSHAMAEYAPNKVIAFNSNCSIDVQDGHMPYGYIEYRTSEDGGENFGEPRALEYSVNAFDRGEFTVSVEKAVACDGRIVAFCL